MYFLDIESLSVESTTVILSIGMLYVKDTNPKTYQELLDESIFLKLNAKEQVENYNRVVDSETLKWWAKQSDMTKKRSFVPSEKDLSVGLALDTLRLWCDKVGDRNKDMVWVRGSLDQMALDSLTKVAGRTSIFPYNSYRDIRTAIDILYPETSKNGYVDIDTNLCSGFDRSQVHKHSPEYDCAFDAAMMLYGVRS
jgi:3' exoribonuclease, RNase T-like